MHQAFSDKVGEAILQCGANDRAKVIKSIRRHKRDSGLFESLILATGPLGLSRWYLGDRQGMIQRLCYLFSAILLYVAAMLALDPLVFAGAGICLLVCAGFWARDWVRRDVDLTRYHSRIEAALLRWMGRASASP